VAQASFLRLGNSLGPVERDSSREFSTQPCSWSSLLSDPTIPNPTPRACSPGSDDRTILNQSAAEAVHTIRRSEVWGGARNVDQDVDLDICTSGLTGSVYSKASDGDAGGDIYFLSVCGEDKLTRFVVADVRGHGGFVKELTKCVYECFQEYMHTLDGGQALAELNTRVSSYGFDAITTAALAGFRLSDSKLCFAYAGHPPMLLKRAMAKRWIPLVLNISNDRSNLPLGVLPETRYDQEEMHLVSGDRLMLYTDGVVECSDANGVEFGVGRLLSSLEASGDRSLAEIKLSVVNELRCYSANWPSEDDVTLMAFEVR